MVFLLLFLAAIGLASAWAAYFIVTISEELPTREDILNQSISEPSIILDRDGRVVARLFTENRTVLQLDQISPWMIKAILAAEDCTFYQHPGIRVGAMMRAAKEFVTRGRVRGASTITQQLARNIFLSHDVTFLRKAKEIIIALRMEQLLTKDEILIKYLNTINFGRGAWGIETAARTYFGISASELNLAQASILAGIIPAPGRFNPISSLTRAKARQNYVLGRMETLGWLTAEERRQAFEEELVFRHVPNTIEEHNHAPYFVSHILFNYLLPEFGADRVYTGGLRIYTTIDLRLQQKAQETVYSMRTQGALVSIEADTGEVLALVGGRCFQESRFNRATQALRQPGSAFKAFVYAAALENDVLPTDHFLDRRVTFRHRGGTAEWSPSNFDARRELGQITVLHAMSISSNIVAVKAAAYIGTQSIVNISRNMGITSPHLPNDLSIALGTASITPLEMTVAHNAFANGGYRTPPVMIREIRAHDGTVLVSNQPTPVRAIRPETAYVLRTVMFDVITGGTGGRARLEGGVEAFGKTGTTNNFVDAWFVGSAPGITTTVYVGNDDNTSLRGTLGRDPSPTGGNVAAPVWKTFMDFAVSTLGTPERFTPAPGWVDVTRVTICRDSGFRARAGCRRVSLYLPSGKLPRAECPTHGGDPHAAMADPNAPRLFLIEQDGYMPQDDFIYVPEIRRDIQPTPQRDAVPFHIPEIEERRPIIENEAAYFERRFRQLLEEFDIN